MRDYKEAKEYIEDIKDICDDFEGLCQRNLFANTGLLDNLAKYLFFMYHIYLHASGMIRLMVYLSSDVFSFKTGMNFYDFFTFITCFTLANLALLCYLSAKYGSAPGSSSIVTQHLVLNLGSIRKVATEMKQMHALEGNHDCFLDIMKTLEDPHFTKLCMGLGRTYMMIHKQTNLSSEFEEAAVNYLMGLNVLKAYTSSQVYTPEDLIELIDNAVAELGDYDAERLSVLHVG